MQPVQPLRRRALAASALGLLVALTLLTGQTARAVTLDINVLSPPPPLTELDTIQLHALTSQEVLPDTTWHTSTSSLVINGFDIDWELTSASQGGIGLQVIIPVAKIETIGPLPAGTYNVTATWVGAAPIWSQHLLPLVGTTQFTVVPEPTTLTVMMGGAGLLCVRWRR